MPPAPAAIGSMVTERMSKMGRCKAVGGRMVDRAMSLLSKPTN